MAQRRNIGAILVSMGRVTEDDVTRALDYQREHGGFLGEALVAMGILSQEELQWSLASQYDIPYVFPDVDSIDPEAAALVTPEWALAHLALPIMKTESTLTVVVDSPLKSRAVEELQARTDLDVQLALASSAKIRELVRQVYARIGTKEGAEREAALNLEQGMSLATEAAAKSFGVSTRGSRVWFWYDDAGTVRRRPLDGRWRDSLDKLTTPALSTRIGDNKDTTLQADLNRDGMITSVEVRYLATRAGEEFVFRPSREPAKVEDRFPSPPQSFLSEIRLLARSGAARFLVDASPDLGNELVAHLPSLLLDPSWRSVHVVAAGSAADDDVFAVEAPADGREWSRQVEALRSFHFDAVSVAASGSDADWALDALEVAPVAFIFADEGLEAGKAHDAGVRWKLGVNSAEGRSLTWTLDPLQV